MRQYLDLLKDIKETGEDHEDRTGVGTRAVFGRQMRFDLSKGFPLMTTKKVFWKGVVYELLWFLKGDTNVKYLEDHGVKIWSAWKDENGDLGPVYGAQWRRFGETYYQHGVDQISEVLQSLRYDPDSRRHIVSLPLPLPIQRGRREALVSALSAFLRRVSWPSVQHCQLLPFDTHDCPRAGTWRRGICLDRWQRSYLQEPLQSDRRTAGPDAA